MRLNGRIDNVRCALQIDVGFGDAVTPEPRTAVFPVLLAEFAAPRLRVYPVYTVIAEKYHAVAVVNKKIRGEHAGGKTHGGEHHEERFVMRSFHCIQLRKQNR